MQKIRVRYAPSPTGVPHIGNIRTALFNFLFAKSEGGAFILRIEDTDRARLIPASIPQIKRSLEVLGLKWDELYFQSKRLSLYKDSLKILEKRNLVYEEEGAWCFKVAKSGKIKWQDFVHGPVEFNPDLVEDFVVIKSDGFPTYHFASVVDDHEMQISHVIRGDEWISSTPKHLLLYEAFSWQVPVFVHVPPILAPEGKKLSKRGGAKSVHQYLQEGYLKEALVNFLALLGWSPKGDRELFAIEELIGEFSLDRLNKNSPIFNLEKLNWFNNQWIKKLDDVDLAKRLGKRFPQYDKTKISSLAPLVRERMKTLLEFETIAGFVFAPPAAGAIPKPPVSKTVVSKISASFENSSEWTASSIKRLIEKVAEEIGEDRVKTIAAVRNITSGQTVTPPLFESLEILGQEETVRRLTEYVKKAK